MKHTKKPAKSIEKKPLRSLDRDALQHVSGGLITEVSFPKNDASGKETP